MLVSLVFFRAIPSDNTLKQELQGIGPGRETLCFPQGVSLHSPPSVHRLPMSSSLDRLSPKVWAPVAKRHTPDFPVVVQLLSCVWLFETPWTAARQASLSYTISWSLLKLMSIELMMPCNHIILCCPLLLLPSIFPSIIELTLHSRWPKYWSFSFSISPSNEYSRSISFRTDWVGCLCGPTDCQDLFQHHN